MFKQRGRRSGFTLPEVLVTVAIVAVLAAIVVPSVTNQIGKGDESQIASNVATLKTSITAFVSDVRKFPARIQHLQVKPASGDSTIPAGTYGATTIARWRSSYMPGSMKVHGNTPQDSLLWGGFAYAIDQLIDSAFAAPNKGYVTLQFGGVTAGAQALKIDSLLDGGSGNAAGSLRWAETTPGTVDAGRLYMLLMGR